MHVGQVMVLLGQCRAQVVAQIAGGEAGIVFHFRGQGKLAQRQRSANAVVLGDGALEHQRLEVGAGGVNGGRPACRAAANDDQMLGNSRHGRLHCNALELVIN